MQKVLDRSKSEPETPNVEAPHNPDGGWSDALGAFADNPDSLRKGGETIYTSDGKAYTIGRVEQAIKAQFEELLMKQAKYWINRTRMSEGPEAYQDELSALVADRGMRAYSWDGRFGRKAREDFPGLIMLLYLLLRRSYGDQATLELAQQIMEDSPKETLLALRWAQGNLPSSSASGGTDRTSKPSTTTMDG
jgi:hypothetical protein